MTVREFDGVDDNIQMAVGGLSGMTFGTVGIILKRGGTLAFHDYFVAHTSGGAAQWGTYFAAGNNNAAWWTTSESAGPVLSSTADWLTIIVRKASGLSTPRWSVYNHTTAAWTHTAGNAAIAEGTAPGAGGTIRFSWEAAEFFKGRVAMRGADPAVLWAADTIGDAQIELAGLEDTQQKWIDAGFDSVWAFNQANTATAVEDLVGTSDQSAITGTAVINGDDPPGFTFSSGATTLTPSVISAPATVNAVTLSFGSITITLPVINSQASVLAPIVTEEVDEPDWGGGMSGVYYFQLHLGRD